MTAFCQPLSMSVAEEMLQSVARAVCDRDGDNQQQRESRTRQMVTSTLGLAPRDGMELMLATLVFGHFQMILDSMSDVFHGQADALKAKTKTTIVPLGRAMLEMLKELRVMQSRPVVGSMEDVKPEVTAEARPAQPAAPAEPTPDSPGLFEADLAILTDPRLALPDEVVAWLAGVAASTPETEVTDPTSEALADTSAIPVQKAPWLTPVNGFAGMKPSLPESDDADRHMWADDKRSVEEHTVSYHETLAAAYETLAQQRAELAADAKAASAD
jgi:hypothetical protein